MEIIAAVILLGVLVFIGYLKFRRVNKGKDCCR